MLEDLREYQNIIKVVASNPICSDCEVFRIVIRPVCIKGKQVFQAECFVGVQVFHINLQSEQLLVWAENNISGKYKQTLIITKNEDITYLTNAKGSVKRLVRNISHLRQTELSNNRRKNYLINEGDNVPVFVDLGIFTKQFKIVNSMFDKFKQINRFVEILNDVFKNFNGQELTLLDFGCGKSYLTFVIYYYFSAIKKIDANIIGYDLKADVVDRCNTLARKYGYDRLKFVVADVSKDELYGKAVDAVVSLHACNTATDFALHYAVTHNAKYIFSVPCCQHEINQSVTQGGDLDLLLKYGIIKERTSALLTDSIRAMLLEDEGYTVDVLEFVDIAHSPKNLMIRAVKTQGKSVKNRSKIEQLRKKYNFKQTLLDLLK